MYTYTGTTIFGRPIYIGPNGYFAIWSYHNKYWFIGRRSDLIEGKPTHVTMKGYINTLEDNDCPNNVKVWAEPYDGSWKVSNGTITCYGK